MIYLSICIPTYNRCNYLFDTIHSIIIEPEFINSDEVEIVVSDNCSTDDTESVMMQFLQQHPSKIKYHRNNENVLANNLEMALSRGCGSMLKLNNDTLNFDRGSLKLLLETVKYCIKNNFIPFLLNGEKPDCKKRILCEDASSFVSSTSFRCTWIGGFFIPKSAFQKFENFSKEADSQLPQVDVLMRLLKTDHKFLIIPEKFFTSISPVKKGGYNLPEIFLTNYFKILKPYFLSKNGLKVYNLEKKKVLYEFILPWLKVLSMDNKQNFSFDTAGYQETIKKEFSHLTYLNFIIALKTRIEFSFFKTKMKSIFNKVNKQA